MSIGTYGVGIGAVGRFNRSLPPNSRAQYDAAYEMAFEVKRWFHYRHKLEVNVPALVDHRNVDKVLEDGYRILLHPQRKYWEILLPSVRDHIREFKDLFRDVLAEMEFTR